MRLGGALPSRSKTHSIRQSMQSTNETVRSIHRNVELAHDALIELGYDPYGPHLNGTMTYGDAVKAENKSEIRRRAFSLSASSQSSDQV